MEQPWLGLFSKSTPGAAPGQQIKASILTVVDGPLGPDLDPLRGAGHGGATDSFCAAISGGEPREVLGRVHGRVATPCVVNTVEQWLLNLLGLSLIHI